MHTVLIVDDEYGIRELLSEILEDEGYQVLTAENAKIAQSLVGKHDFDLILLDIWMPDMDGISLLKEWYSHNTVRCPIVMMSGHGTIETAMEATRFGAMDFLEKPISMQQLLKTCKQMIQFWEHEKVSRPRENEQAKAASVALAGWKKASCSPLNVSLANLNDKSRFCDHFILTDISSSTSTCRCVSFATVLNAPTSPASPSSTAARSRCLPSMRVWSALTSTARFASSAWSSRKPPERMNPIT